MFHLQKILKIHKSNRQQRQSLIMELFWMIGSVSFGSYSCASIDLVSFMYEQSHKLHFQTNLLIKVQPSYRNVHKKLMTFHVIKYSSTVNFKRLQGIPSHRCYLITNSCCRMSGIFLVFSLLPPQCYKDEFTCI